MADTWLNNDKLYIKYGTSETTPQVAGETKVFGSSHIVEVVLDMTTLTSTDAILCDTVMIPKGAFIEKVETIATTACTGSSSTFTLGLYKTDRSAVNDSDGYIAAQALTTLDAAGETTTHQIGSTYVGSSVGVSTSENTLISGKYGTAVFSAGKVRVRIFYSLLA